MNILDFKGDPHHGNLQIIFFKCPYYSLLTEQNLELYAQLKSFKVANYTNHYGVNVLPIDTTDEIGDHIIVRRNNKIIMATKSVDILRCNKFNLAFSPENYIHLFPNNLDIKIYQDLVKSSLSKGNNISYDSSWTIDSSIKKDDPDLYYKLLELEIAILYLYHTDPAINVELSIVLGVIDIKTDKMFKKFGYKELSQTAIVPHPQLFNSKCLMLYATERDFSPKARQLASKYLSLWNNRLVVDEEKSNQRDEVING